MARIYKTKDNQSISYNQSGQGPGLVLLHGGYTQDKSIWSELSYVRDLSKQFTVVSIDIRGLGESSKPKLVEYYSIDRLASDIEGVCKVEALQEYFIWGFSLGASIALHCADQLSVRGVIAGGTYFGPDLSEYARTNIESLERIIAIKRRGLLVESELSEADRYFIRNADLDVVLAISKAMSQWTTIEPDQVCVPTLVYSGTEDKTVSHILQRQANKIRAAGIRIELLEGLDHFDLINNKQVVFPMIAEFLFACLDR